ncbi:SAP30-binding protein-like [Mytilus galloprovincialis]|uniref:SAP30-binding protein n=2 Tax=Mytilus TaxID=6548 RepID=A0A8B6E3C5_MYTGA|nr:SAP30-binding protein [Mytilus edulis]VDI28292.1 Hypothetical predicted protein [Mytilus galloprovincialis]
MERIDSTAAMASLASYDETSDKSDDEAIVNIASVDNISDDDDEDSRPPSQPATTLELEDENSKSESTPQSQDTAPKPKPHRKITRLVSNYGLDEEEGDEDDMSISSEEEEEEEEESLYGPEKRVDRTTSLNAEQASSLSRSMLNKSFDEIEIPPAPPGKCPAKLQDKISGLFEKMRKGLDMNDKIQRRKDFRNPSIYEKLIEFIGIDEKGSNYPAEVFDPHAWGKESFYDQLDKAQKVEMEKREKERKDRTKVEFVTGTKRPQSSTDVTSGDDKKRKTKWDNQPTSNVTGSRGGLPGVINPNVVSGSASGTKSTVIPATGNITKKTK